MFEADLLDAGVAFERTNTIGETVIEDPGWADLARNYGADCN